MAERLYSVEVWAEEECGFPDYLVHFDEGLNVSVLVLADPDAFRRALAEAGVRVRRLSALDGLEAVPTHSLTLDPTMVLTGGNHDDGDAGQDP